MRLLQKIFIVILIIFSAPALAQTGIIKGRIYNHKNNEPVPFANIIVDGKPDHGTTSDIDGNYTLAGLSPGFIRLAVSSVGFKQLVTEDVMVTNARQVIFDIPMDEQVVTLNQVEIKASPFTHKDESPVSMQTLNIREIERSPGSNRDVSKVIQSLPGVASIANFRNDVIVRGGGSSENRFYLDGVEIPNLNHFATQGASGGPVGIINVDFIREVEFYSGAFPASRGNALSSILEFRQIDGNKDKFSARLALGSSDLGLTLNGPVTKNSSLIFSYRRSYLKLLFTALKLPFLPIYNDYQLKYKISFDKRNQLSVISIGALDQSSLNTGIKNPDESQKYLLGYLPEYDQWTYTFGLVYRHFREKGYDTWVFSRNMLDNRRIKFKNNVRTPDSLLVDYKSQEIENKVRYEGVTDLVNWKMMYGAGLEYARYTNDTYQKFFIGDQVKPVSYNSSLDLFKWHLFGQVSRPFFNDRLQLSLGIRSDANSYSSGMSNLLDQLSPRFSASYSLSSSKKWFLNFNAGRFYQLPPYTALGYRDSKGKLVNDSLGIRYISADHVVAGVEFLPVPDAKISLEGFYKFYRHYPFSIRDSVAIASKGTEYDVFGDEPLLSISKGRAYGLEVLLRDADFFGFNVILSYTYVRSEFTNYFGRYIPSSWDNRHLLTFTLGYKFKRNWEIGAKWRFVGGAPYTPYDENKSGLVSAWDAQGKGYLDYSQFNTLRLKAFNQLDMRVDKEFFFRKWSLMLYLDIQNLLNYKGDQQDYLVNIQPDGSVQKYIDNQGAERYKLRYIPGTSGTVLPSIGIIIEL